MIHVGSFARVAAAVALHRLLLRARARCRSPFNRLRRAERVRVATTRHLLFVQSCQASSGLYPARVGNTLPGLIKFTRNGPAMPLSWLSCAVLCARATHVIRSFAYAKHKFALTDTFGRQRESMFNGRIQGRL